MVLIGAARHHLLLLMEMGERAGVRETLAASRRSERPSRKTANVDFLWGHENDGLEEDTERMNELGIGKALLFENWFKPYRSGPD